MLTLLQQAIEVPASLLARALSGIGGSVACEALATVPPTSILGAILWTGYFGDLAATHLRIF